MTDRRPPKDAAHDTDTDGAEEAAGQSEGKRSQTLPAGASGARAARSAFQPPAPAADSDKTVKRAYPNAWGATLLVGNAVPPPDGSRPMTDTEKTVVSEFPPPASASRAEPVRSAPPNPGAEPLREPSNRPVPTPFQQSQKTRAAVSGTLLMPGVNADELAAARAPKAASSARPNPPSPAAPRAQQAPPPTPPQSDVAPRTTSAARSGHASAPVAAAPAKTTSAPPVHRTEPLHLSLDARDMVPKATNSVRPGIPRTRAPLMFLIAGIGVLTLIAALAWFRHAAPTADASAPAADGLRSSAVPATPTTAPAAPVAPAASALPSAPAAQPATPAAAQKPAATVAEEHAQPAAKSGTAPALHGGASPSAPAEAVENKPAAASSKAASHQAAATKAHSTASKAPSENSESIEDAREALKALESPPVVRVKRKADSDEPAPTGDEGAPPPPPPLPDPEGE